VPVHAHGQHTIKQKFETHSVIRKEYNNRGLCTRHNAAEMSIVLDLGWTQSGLYRFWIGSELRIASKFYDQDRI